ncbi:MAG: hypothetical protein U1C52_00590 [Patescibacteria group bacterium]|nr:hypothetical protein [Patescibacteria group bacterium]
MNITTKKIAYIIPGYCESHLRQRGYNKIAKFFEEYGIEPIHVDIDWKQSSPERFSNYTEQFLEIYKKPKGVEVYILGFSYGATIAFLTTTKTKPKTLILCSLSPYFKEDLNGMKPSWIRWFRKNFIESDYSFTKLAPKVKSKTYLIVGDEEDKSCLIRAKDAREKIQDSKLSIAKGAKHKIGQREYLETVKRVISKL